MKVAKDFCLIVHGSSKEVLREIERVHKLMEKEI